MSYQLTGPYGSGPYSMFPTAVDDSQNQLHPKVKEEKKVSTSKQKRVKRLSSKSSKSSSKSKSPSQKADKSYDPSQLYLSQKDYQQVLAFVNESQQFNAQSPSFPPGPSVMKPGQAGFTAPFDYSKATLSRSEYELIMKIQADSLAFLAEQARATPQQQQGGGQPTPTTPIPSGPAEPLDPDSFFK